jgi:uroporphyrinogen-III synthase
MARLSELGAQPVAASAIRITLTPPESLIDDCAKATKADWMIFTSVNGVKGFASAMRPAATYSKVRIACVGPITAQELSNIGLRARVVAARTGASVNLAERLDGVLFGLVYWFRGNLADPGYESRLLSVGAERLVSVEAYRTTPEAINPTQLQEPDIILLSSASTATSLAASLRGSTREGWLTTKPVFALGPQTLAAARQEGMLIGGMAERPTLDSLIESILRHPIGARDV